MTIISVDNITKKYPNGTVAINGISFSVESGEQVIILGHNGSGKSTLFRSITGFETLTSGSIHIFGEEINPNKKRQLRNMRKRIGMVFQYFGLITNISVFQNVLFGALGKVKFAPQTYALFASNELREKAMDCLRRVGLEQYAKHRADELSGGQKQRIAIARMLMQDPEIILADEPIASLDPKAGREIMNLLISIAEERNLTLVMILHQMEMAKEFGKRIIALKHGEIVLDSDVSALTAGFEQSLFNTETESDLSKDDDDDSGDGRENLDKQKEKEVRV